MPVYPGAFDLTPNKLDPQQAGSKASGVKPFRSIEMSF